MGLNEMKLSRLQKIMRKDWIEELANMDGFIINQYGGTTMAVMPLGRNTAKVAFAMCHPNDKYNCKYGEFIALHNLFSWTRFCAVIPMSIVDVIAEELESTDIL